MKSIVDPPFDTQNDTSGSPRTPPPDMPEWAALLSDLSLTTERENEWTSVEPAVWGPPDQLSYERIKRLIDYNFYVVVMYIVPGWKDPESGAAKYVHGYVIYGYDLNPPAGIKVFDPNPDNQVGGYVDENIDDSYAYWITLFNGAKVGLRHVEAYIRPELYQRPGSVT